MLLLLLGLAAPAAAYTDINVREFMYKNVDPIVYPGQYAKSHLHTFFGSDAVKADTTTSAQLQAGCATAENPNDFSTYWVPTLLASSSGKKDDASYKPVPVGRFTAYYNLGSSPAEVPIPQNLKMTAGSASAQTAAEAASQAPDAKISWACEGDAAAGADAAGFPAASCSTYLQALLYFPDCVDEGTLATAYSGRAHLEAANRCPAGMKRMPQLRFSIRYDVRKAVPAGWKGQAPLRLSSGSAYSSHGDFINGWLPEAAENMVATSKDKYKFSGVSGPKGGYKDGSACKARDADPKHGTSDFATSVKQMKSSVKISRSRINAAGRDEARV